MLLKFALYFKSEQQILGTNKNRNIPGSIFLCLQQLADGEQSSLGVESIEYSLYHEDIHSAVQESCCLLGVRCY